MATLHVGKYQKKCINPYCNFLESRGDETSGPGRNKIRNSKFTALDQKPKRPERLPGTDATTRSSMANSAIGLPWNGCVPRPRASKNLLAACPITGRVMYRHARTYPPALSDCNLSIKTKLHKIGRDLSIRSIRRGRWGRGRRGGAGAGCAHMWLSALYAKL